MIKFLPATFILTLLLAGHGLTAQHKSLLYKISGQELDSPSYIFGTIHLLCPEDLLLSKELETALKESEQLILELDFDDPEMMTELQSGIMLEEGSTLQSFYSEEEFAAIDTFTTNAFGQSARVFNGLKPIFLMSMLYPQYLGCQTVSLESELVNMASGDNQEVLGLESVEEQLDAIDEIGLDVQAAMLLEAVTEYKAQRIIFFKTLELYKKQDLDGLYTLTMEEMEGYESFNETLLIGRNIKWIDRIEKFISDKPSFIAVGAAHLGGEQGVLRLLENAGYTITPVITK